MPRKPSFAPPDPSVADPERHSPAGAGTFRRSAPAGEAGGTAELPALPVAGLSRRRMLIAAVVLAVAWLAIAFIRQVGDVTAASSRAAALRAANEQLAADVSARDAELSLIQRQAYIVQQARAFRLGSPREVPFSLEGPLPSLPPDAPGSAGLRVGAAVEARSPLDGWLTVLFGPDA